jgi:hypothetical protein
MRTGRQKRTAHPTGPNRPFVAIFYHVMGAMSKIFLGVSVVVAGAAAVPAMFTVNWANVTFVSKTTTTLQVVVNPMLNSPIAGTLWDTLAYLVGSGQWCVRRSSSSSSCKLAFSCSGRRYGPLRTMVPIPTARYRYARVVCVCVTLCVCVCVFVCVCVCVCAVL